MSKFEEIICRKLRCTKPQECNQKKNTNPERKIIDLHLTGKTYSANAATGEKDKTTNGTKIDDKLDRHVSLPLTAKMSTPKAQLRAQGNIFSVIRCSVGNEHSV